MRIKSHRLIGDDISQLTSPNQGGPFAAAAPDTLILHFTNGDDAAWAIDALRDPTPGGRVSAHLVVPRDGAVTQLVPFDTIAWHAGHSAWGGRTDFNQCSIGIEIDNAGRLQPEADHFVSWRGTGYDESDVVQATHRNERAPSWWHRYPQPQLDRVELLCALLVDRYKMRWILGHEEIAPDRKHDPGPAFPLDELRQRVLGQEPMLFYEDMDKTPV